MMKNNGWNNVMEQLDDDIVAEAAHLQRKKKRIRTPYWLGMAACFCLIASFIAFHLPEGESKSVKDIAYRSSDDLDTISQGFFNEGAGGSEDTGWFMVKSLDDVKTQNPTWDQVGEIKELPVFKNGPELISDYKEVEANEVKKEIYFDHAKLEQTTNYCFDGRRGERWCKYFKNDNDKSIVDQLLDYSFYTIDYAMFDNEGLNKTYNVSKINPPANEGILYPIISLEEAETYFRNGEFSTCGTAEEKVAKTAKILGVEIVYMMQEYQEYVQPFYTFYITDDSWDVSTVMTCDNVEDYFSISKVYVPAVERKYLKDLKTEDIRVNW